ncbi:(pine wood nematode) hypothetical protein [Aphelenchoides fujianensis]|nr:(pine wood nematode) hypothetical protein [Aphelenchoides fujianensis]
MNRSTKIRAQNQINERELELGYSGDSKKSWHQVYKESAWIYVSGLDYDFTEGDLLAVFSQYGEIMNVNIVRDYKTLKSKGFAFICYKDQRSTNLAVDNFNGIKLAGRLIQVDHCKEFKPPKYKESVPPEILKIWEEGCAPKPINISKEEIEKDQLEQRRKIERALKKTEEVMQLSESKEVRKEKKKIKKELKRLKRREKEERKRMRGATPIEERGRADDEGSWANKRKEVDYRTLKDDDFYGASEHFNFNKKRKELTTVTHNIRPDFDKADWRDIELFKIVREKDKAEHGEKPITHQEETHYVPKRMGGGH